MNCVLGKPYSIVMELQVVEGYGFDSYMKVSFYAVSCMLQLFVIVFVDSDGSHDPGSLRIL